MAQEGVPVLVPATVTGLEEKETTPSGKPYILITFTTRIFQSVDLLPPVQWKAGELLTACGIVKDKDLTFSPQGEFNEVTLENIKRCLGKNLTLKVMVEDLSDLGFSVKSRLKILRFLPEGCQENEEKSKT